MTRQNLFWGTKIKISVTRAFNLFPTDRYGFTFCIQSYRTIPNQDH